MFKLKNFGILGKALECTSSNRVKLAGQGNLERLMKGKPAVIGNMTINCNRMSFANVSNGGAYTVSNDSLKIII